MNVVPITLSRWSLISGQLSQSFLKRRIVHEIKPSYWMTGYWSVQETFDNRYDSIYLFCDMESA